MLEAGPPGRLGCSRISRGPVVRGGGWLGRPRGSRRGPSRRSTKPGRHSDGDGLYLVVDPSGAKRWLFLFRWGGKLKEMGLGGLGSVSLAEAREKATEARRVLGSGKNPIEQRRAAQTASDTGATFGTFADSIVARCR